MIKLFSVKVRRARCRRAPSRARERRRRHADEERLTDDAQEKQAKEAAERAANGGATTRQSSGEVRVSKGASTRARHDSNARTRVRFLFPPTARLTGTNADADRHF